MKNEGVVVVVGQEWDGEFGADTHLMLDSLKRTSKNEGRTSVADVMRGLEGSTGQPSTAPSKLRRSDHQRAQFLLDPIRYVAYG